jgi:hypothetical protein
MKEYLMTSFTGNIEELKKLVYDCGISGGWDQSSQGDKYTFRGKCTSHFVFSSNQ